LLAETESVYQQSNEVQKNPNTIYFSACYQNLLSNAIRENIVKSMYFLWVGLWVAMARRINILTARAVSNIDRPGLYGDGAGLYLQVGPTGTKSWLFRYMRHGKARAMGLGSVRTVGLSKARTLAAGCRQELLDGKDPIAVRQSERNERKISEARTTTFKECAESYVETHRTAWKSDKHKQQWENTLRDYVFPTLGRLPVAVIDTDLVLKCLTPIWTKKTETATRVRGRIESILDWATASKLRQGENPARWRGHLENLLPAPTKLAPVNHHPALPYAELPAFITALRACSGVAARAFEFTILTASRTNEVLGARWDEFDLKQAIWTIPAERMKMGHEHRAPLSRSAQAILGEMLKMKQSDFVFPGNIDGKPLSNMALLMTLRRMKRPDLTAHGFRSTFRDWAAEKTSFAREVAEMALAHAIEDKVEAAYRRGDLFDKRRKLMEAWAKFAMTVPASSPPPSHPDSP
jgi:integrase